MTERRDLTIQLGERVRFGDGPTVAVEPFPGDPKRVRVRINGERDVELLLGKDVPDE